MTDLRHNESVGWWVSGILAALLIGVLTGQYLPNRSVVTSQELDNKIQPLIEAETAQTVEIAALKDVVNDMKGQLKAQKLIAP